MYQILLDDLLREKEGILVFNRNLIVLLIVAIHPGNQIANLPNAATIDLMNKVFEMKKFLEIRDF